MVITNNFIAELPTVIYMLSLDLSNAWSEFESGISINYIKAKKISVKYDKIIYRIIWIVGVQDE